MTVFIFARTGTVVSSAWVRSARSTWVRIASHERRQRDRTGADPIGERRGVDLDPLAGEGLALAVERLVQQELGS